MRVLLVVHGFPPEAAGGAEIHAEQHALALATTFGDDVHVLTREARQDRPEYAVRTERRGALTITWINNTFRETHSYEDSYRSDRIARIASRVIDDVRPDVAHVHHLTCLSTEIPRLLSQRGVPVFFTLHDYWLLCHRGQLLDRNLRPCPGPEPGGCSGCLDPAVSSVPATVAPIVRRIARRLPRAVASAVRATASRVRERAPESSGCAAAAARLQHMREVCAQVTRFLAPSESIRSRFIAFGIAPERIELSPYGFDCGTHRSAPSSGGPLRAGFVGTLMVSKAPHLLIEACRRFPPGVVTVDIVGKFADYHGDSSYRSVLEPLLSGPGVRVHGSIPRQRVLEMLPTLDVLVVPSVWPETSPLVIHEALLAGVPVVASNVGGIPELVQHERNGLLFERANVDELHNALRRLADDRQLLDALKAGAAATPVRSLADDVGSVRRCYEQQRAARTAVPQRRLAAVVVNYRTPDDTALAVASLLASDRRPDEVIVVDNDAGGTCRERLPLWGESIVYLPMERNRGFSGGMNAGVRLALERGAHAVLLVNSDVVTPPDCIGRLDAALAAVPGAGIAGPVVMTRAMPDLEASCGIDYNSRTGRMRHRVPERGQAVPAPGELDTGVPAVSGCFMLVARAVFERAGFLDERYFFGFEEIDFCLRARNAGLLTVLVGGAAAYHEGGQSIGMRSPQRLYFAARNHLMLASAPQDGEGSLSRRARLLYVIALNLAHACRARGGSMPARIVAVVRGIRDFARGRVGGEPIAGRLV